MKSSRDKILCALGTDALKRVEDAVGRAEAGTSGEIVTYFAWECDRYPEAVWKGAALAVAIACLAIIIADRRQPLWQPLHQLLAAILAAAALGAGAGRFLAPLRRWLIGPRRLAAMAHRRAEEVFLHKELFKTAQRTGILIFVSLFERHTVVLADSGINAKVGQQDWDRAVAHVIDHAGKAGLAEGMVRAVDHCHQLLLQKGFKAAPGDRNELSDKPLLDGDGA